LAGARGDIAAAAPDNPGVAASFAASDLPRGTSALIGAGVVIVAGGDVLVAAAERNDYLGVAGAAAAGLGAVGGSVVVATLRSNVTATVSAGASITAGGDVTVSADTRERSRGAAFAGAAGGLTLSGQIVVIDSDAAQ